MAHDLCLFLDILLLLGTASMVHWIISVVSSHAALEFLWVTQFAPHGKYMSQFIYNTVQYFAGPINTYDK